MKSTIRKLLIIQLLCIAMLSLSKSQKLGYNYLPDSINTLLLQDTISSHSVSRVINYAKKQERGIGKNFVPLMMAVRIKARSINDTMGIIRSYHYQGKYFGHVGKYPQSIESHEKALELSESSRDTLMTIASLNNIGSSYRKQDQNNVALTILYDALHLAEEYRNDYWVAMIQNNIGNAFQGQKDYDRALETFKKSLEYGIRKNNTQHLEISYGCIGETFLLKKELDSASYYVNKSEKYSELRNSTIGLALSKYLKGRILSEQGKYEEAEQALKSSLKIHRRYRNNRYVNYCLNELGVVYMREGNYTLSEEMLLEAKKMALVLSSYENAIKACESLSELYWKKELPQAAIEELKAAQNYKDYLFNESKMKLIEELNIAYETEKRETLIREEKAKVAVLRQRRKSTLFISVVAITLLLMLLTAYSFVARNRRKVNRKLREVNKLKTNFFNNISHEFITPITLIEGTTSRLIESESQNPQQTEAYQTISRNCNRLLNLVNQLLNLSKIDVGKYHYYFQKGNLSALLEDYVGPFEQIANRKDLQFHYNIQKTGEVWFSPELLETIVYNLLSNAIKYCSKKGEIVVNFAHDAATSCGRLTVMNHTDKITKNLPLLFDRFYQASESSEGVGLGLSIVKEMANLYHGNINVQKAGEQRVQFVFEFTTDKKKLPQENIVEDAYQQERTEKSMQNIWTEEQQTEELLAVENDTIPRLLIVEDNREMRDYIASCFNGKHSVYHAENGQQGFSMAMEKVPDIIITDRVMPVMNGAEMCKLLQKDVLTKHIPIIMLTAKAGQEDRQAGLECGAVDYITKPFHNRTLVLKVNNILAVQNELKKKYRTELVIKSLDMVFGKEEHDFAYKLQQVLDKHITNPDLNVGLLSDLMGTNRTQLYRKIKEHTGLSVVEFIKTRRINMAVGLLEKNTHIKGVCYDVGFNNPSYFAKTFKEIIGCLPSEYIQRN